MLPGYVPHEHQVEIHYQLQYHRFGVLVCHRRFGKTLAMIVALVLAALACEKELGRFVYLAPYLKQAKKFAWPYLKKFGMMVEGARKNESELYIEFPNGARVTLDGADNPEALRGGYLDGIVPDEVASMKAEVYEEIIRPALADRKGWCVFIGTPKGLNQFYQLYQIALHEDDWFAKVYRADETNLPWLDAEELRLSRQVMSENTYRQEYLCDFNASSDNILITIDLATRAAHRQVVSEESLVGFPKILGIDVGRFGDDESVITRRWGHMSYPQSVFSKLGNMELVGRIASEIKSFEPDAVFIDQGQATGVIDRLHQLGFTEVIEVPFGSAATDPHYANKRMEMYDNARDWLEHDGCISDDIELKSQLSVSTYKFTTSNRMILEEKDKIKERLGRSPDRADSLILTFAHPVMPKDESGVRVKRKQQFSQKKYVPPWQRN